MNSIAQRRWLRFSLPTLVAVIALVGLKIGRDAKWIQGRHEVLASGQCRWPTKNWKDFVGLPRAAAPLLAPSTLRLYGECGFPCLLLKADASEVQINRVKNLFPEATVLVHPG